jgi:biopolymer transport protein ExbB
MTLLGLSPKRPVAPISSGHAPFAKRLAGLLLVGLVMCLAPRAPLAAQESGPQAEADSPQPPTVSDIPVDGDAIRDLLTPKGTASPAKQTENQALGIDLLTLIARGGNFMIPIGVMSILVVTLSVERMISLRRRRLMPPALIGKLQRLADPIERFNPTSALAACQEHPSALATTVSAMLLRTGQPIADVERAASEALQREADDQAAPIRWLSLAASATPLMGLLGTVWGMIVAFHESTTLSPDRSRSEQLSEGIYVALVTTLAGLIVAIPAAILAQYLENRLGKHFNRIERIAFGLAPTLVRFVGRARLHADGSLHSLPSATGRSRQTATSPTGNVVASPPTANPIGGASSSLTTGGHA